MVMPHGHSHGHGDEHGDVHDDHHQDLNLKSAYVHVITDAATSVLCYRRTYRWLVLGLVLVLTLSWASSVPCWLPFGPKA